MFLNMSRNGKERAPKKTAPEGDYFERTIVQPAARLIKAIEQKAKENAAVRAVQKQAAR
jgi:hypothetical protein